MPLTDQARIAKERLSPHIVQLWRALTPLQTIVSFMNTGAHPDDETTAMLAAIGLRDGIDISYACSTRGEGGQNDIGTETTEALGTLRTAEMEQACNVVNLRMYWLSESPDDAIFDFGFSKSGVETLDKWGRARTLKRFVDIVRSERPDIICPTFLDIPGQHGHHRAMTEAAHLVMDLAADPAFTDSSLPVWQVKKLYLPAWSGAGQSYDDDLPPPPATLTIDASGLDPVTGWSFARIAQQSRAFHRTQAMGHWVPAGSEQDWPLHLADSRVAGPDTSLSDALPVTLKDLDVPETSKSLALAHEQIEAARASFPDTSAIVKHASAALGAVQTAIAACPDAARDAILHKLIRKETQLSHLIRIASGVEVIGRLTEDRLRPGDYTSVVWETRNGSADDLTITQVLPDHWSQKAGKIHVGPGAAISDPYPLVYLPDNPVAPCLSAAFTVNGVTTNCRIPLEVRPIVLPAHSATLQPAEDVLNIATERRQIDVSIGDVGPPGAQSELIVPDGWRATRTDAGFAVTAPVDVAPGMYRLALTLDGKQAQSVQIIDYQHIAPRLISRPAEISVRVLDATLSEVRVGYIGGGNDRVDHWLARIGVDVTGLTDADLQSDATLAGFDTLLIGIFAMKSRDGLAAQMARLHRWCENGGTLVTLYHRPWDNWYPDKVPPKRLEIGQPSLRWRVTDENAKVTVLAPEHPLLNIPNAIESGDWTGWHKERGLYFAKEWDKAYAPLLSMADPDEEPLLGSLLVADIGAGRHVHTSLIFHHQMEKLTPGAFRIIANLLARRN